MERAHRVVIVGFPRKTMQTSLKRAADLFIMTGIPQDRPGPIVRTYDTTNTTRKMVLDYADATKGSDFLITINTHTPTPFPDPIYPQQQIMLRAKRDIEPGTRMLFVAIGQVRGMIATVMQQIGKDMGPNGLGGGV